MNKFDNQISRMKAMMNYGLQTEGKTQYSTIEYNRVGADGKMYGIVREGTKFYIKVSNKTENVLKENFDYIGGFRNRKDHEYTSYANALKNFEMKMHSINEALGRKESIVIESWNPDRKEELTVEATDKMRKEIARQRQIMGNSALIQEKKNYTVNLGEGGCCKVDKECASTQKDNITKKSDGIGDATGQGGDPFTKNTSKNIADAQKDNIKGDNKPVMEGEEVLGWNPDEEYLDTDTETEIGDADPFVEECASMHNSENQNCPSVGTSEVGDGDPFDEELQVEGEEGEELIDDYESEEMTDVDADFDGDEEIDSDDVEGDEEIDADDVDFESDLEDMTDEASEEEEFDGDIETRLSAIEGLIRQLADKMGVSTFDDDDLYDDENEELNDEDEFADEESEDEEDIEVFESINFRKAMLSENDYFGKHPAYEKEPMILPSNNHDEKEGYYDMNDESVENEDEYGQEIGDSEPFEIDVESIENAVAESIQRMCKKKNK